MATTTAIATLQTAWDCRWSRPGCRLVGVRESDQPETLWVCIRTENRTPIRETDCETCPCWERDDTRGN